jgi:hypothetical protein
VVHLTGLSDTLRTPPGVTKINADLR